MRSSKSVLIIAVLVIAWAILPANQAQEAYACTPWVVPGTCTNNSVTVNYNGTSKTYACANNGSKYYACSNLTGCCDVSTAPGTCLQSCQHLLVNTSGALHIGGIDPDVEKGIQNILAYNGCPGCSAVPSVFMNNTYFDIGTAVTVPSSVAGSANLAFFDSLTFSAGVQLDMGTNLLSLYGRLAGAGLLNGNMGNAGTFALQGSSPVGFSISGNFTNFILETVDLTAFGFPYNIAVPFPGTVVAELGGTTSCLDGTDCSTGSYSHLDVTSTADMGGILTIQGFVDTNNVPIPIPIGTVSVVLSPGYFPKPGDTFNIISAPNITREYVYADLTNLKYIPFNPDSIQPGLKDQLDQLSLYSPQCLWHLDYGSNTVTLSNGRCADAGLGLSVPLANATNTTINGGVHGLLQGNSSLKYSWYEVSPADGSETSLLTGAAVGVPAGGSDFGGCPLDLSTLSTLNPSTLSIGAHQLRLKVSDSSTPPNTATAEMILTIDTPIANAGPNQTVHEGNTVTLDGSTSSDPLGLVPLTYAWSFVSMPANSTATLPDPTAVNPKFTADQTGNYVLQLVVTDAAGLTSTPSTVTISTTNTAPVADPGPDQFIIPVGSTVNLDGSHSYDPDGDPMTYAWTFTSIPKGSKATLAGVTTAKPTFVADVDGTYVIQLVVTDFWGVPSDPKSVMVSFNNIKPVAVAGASQTGVVGDPVILNGSGSHDDNLLSLTYQWSFVSLPPWSKAVVSNPTAAQAVFVPDLPGIYIVQLVVKDDFLTSDPSTAQIKVISEKTYIHGLLMNLATSIGSLDCKAFKNCSMRNDLIRRLHDVTTDVEMRCHGDALQDLNDILRRVDGCTASGVPDRDDWIVNCTSQKSVYGQLVAIIAEVKELDGGVMRK